MANEGRIEGNGRATYNSLSVFGMSGDEEGILGERRQRLGARGIEVIKGFCAACQVKDAERRDAFSVLRSLMR